MRHANLRSVASLTILAIFAVTVSGTASGQSVWQKMKQAALEQACRGGDQKACQKLQQQGQQPQHGQQPQQGQQPQPATSSSAQPAAGVQPGGPVGGTPSAPGIGASAPAG